MNKTVVIAIDGTSASGKSTNARLVAQANGAFGHFAFDDVVVSKSRKQA